MKSYIKPTSEIILLSSYNMLASSPGVIDEFSSGEQYSNQKGGWDSSDWETSEEE